MHINLESDYAVRIVHCLAGAGQRMDAQTLAEKTGVSPRFTLKIMRKLGAAEIVRSFKGAHGGYTLARPASEITLRQVIEAVEGPYRFSRCLDKDFDCSRTDNQPCPFRSIYGRITTMVVKELDAVTFDKMDA